MAEQQWSYWEPIPHLANEYSIDHIRFNARGLKIVISEMQQEHKTIEILFKNSVIAYTKTDESFVLGLEGDFEQLPEKKDNPRWTFFKTINSRYLKQIAEKYEYSIADYVHLIHFVILADDAVVDIIANYEPEVIIKNWNMCTFMLLYKERILPIVIRYFPTAKIILYGPRSRAEGPVKKYGINPMQIAIDIGFKIGLKNLKELKETILHESFVSVPCDIVDLHAVSQELRQQILQEGIDWKEAKDI